MVCARCGKPVASSESFCGRCGARLSVGVLTPLPADVTTLGPDQTADSDPTILAGSPDATRLLAADETRFASVASDADPEATRLAGPSGPQTPIPPSLRSDADHGPLAIGQTFGSRYHIIRLLGIGGMGAVYQAWDAELAVTVALKVIRPEVMADPKTAAEIERRFKRELLLARQVTHRNVVRIHDLGEVNGIKYITMSYIEGSDLATVLKQAGRLPPERVLRIARSVVAGLVEAHKADIVHRDLKPANIMIDNEDQALIMDFGIARSTGRPIGAQVPGNTTIINNLRLAAEAPAEATVLGAVVGTVEYMAPEQARAHHVDQRADIYALGLILYDMLAGQQRARRAPSAIAELQARMEHAPPPVRTLAPEVPVPLEELVSRCLEPDPAKRFQTSRELADALTWLNDKGERIRVRRVVGVRLFAAAIVLGLLLLVGTWWFARGPAVPVQHEPVTVLIADFQNQSSDASLDGTLEPIVKLALEGAGFINAFDRTGLRSIGARAEKLDEPTAREIALRQAVGVLIAGSIERQGSGFQIALRAMRTVTGGVIADVNGRASSKDQVLGVATRLATKVREALGDDVPDSEKQFAMDTLSATSLEVVRHYAAAQEAVNSGKFEQALQSFSKAVEVDPNFGIGYLGLAATSRNLDRHEDAVKYAKIALTHLPSMTDRERFRARGFFFRVTGEYDKCVREYGDLVDIYPADALARNQVALCRTFLRDVPKAVEEMREVVKILPKRTLYRENLALYLNYQGDFPAAERETRMIEGPSAFGVLALAFAQLGQDQLPQAIETYKKVAAVDALGASYAASGLADLAVYEGRFSDAIRLLESGISADLASKDADRAAAKFVAQAYARVQLKQNDRAALAAESALKHGSTVKIRFLAARNLVEAGRTATARTLAAALASEPHAEPRAHAKILEGQIALKSGNAGQAIKSLKEATALLDTWIGHFELGRAYLEAGQFLDADSEFDRCIKRRGEAVSLFLDEEPSYGYFPPVYYYQGRVREALKMSGFADSYRAYVHIRGTSKEDPLLADVVKRAGS